MKHFISVAVVLAFAIGMIARPVKAAPANVVNFAKDEVAAKDDDKPKKSKDDPHDNGKGNDDGKDDKGKDDKGKGD